MPFCLIQLALAHSYLVTFPVKHVSTYCSNDFRGYPCHHISGHILNTESWLQTLLLQHAIEHTVFLKS